MVLDLSTKPVVVIPGAEQVLEKTERMYAREILVNARALIVDRENWCVGTLAENVHNQTVSPTSGGAVRWCAIGALSRTVGTDSYPDPAHQFLQYGTMPGYALALEMLFRNGLAMCSDYQRRKEWGAGHIYNTNIDGEICYYWGMIYDVNDSQELGHSAVLKMYDNSIKALSD